MTKSHWRGHEIEYENGRWVYADTRKLVSGKERPCGNCGKAANKGNDACLGKLPGVQNACCGHGFQKESYIQFKNGTIVQGFLIAEA